MSALRILGLLFLLVGVVLQPLGWIYAMWLAAVSFAAIVLGVLLLYAGKKDDAEGGAEPSGRAAGRGMPGDIHGHSGQLSGGRSTAWESHSADGGGASD
jgi:hypothetical protein